MVRLLRSTKRCETFYGTLEKDRLHIPLTEVTIFEYLGQGGGGSQETNQRKICHLPLLSGLSFSFC